MREKGLLKIGANFEVGSQSPWDARLIVEEFEDLTIRLEETYPEKNIYKGMCVTVVNEATQYILDEDPGLIYETPAGNRSMFWKRNNEIETITDIDITNLFS